MKAWPAVKETAPVALSSIIPMTQAVGELIITVSKGQAWDSILEGAFQAGGIVLVLDDREAPLYAFRRASSDTPAGRGN